jgi:glyoxylase-like metal-dependent hydrolase (beta-lactamase superfamily II)
MIEKPQAYASGLYGLVGGAVNVYVLDDPQSGVTIIDTGIPGSAQRIIKLVQAIGHTPQDVHHILVTHADIDHVGNLKRLVDMTGATVYTSKKSDFYIQHRQSPPHITFPMSIPVGIMNFFFSQATPVKHIVENDEILDIAGGMRAVAAPGHTPDHICYFWEREKVLFAGDLIGYKAQLLTVSPQSPGDISEARKSTQHILSLNPTVICPGHGPIWQLSNAPEQITKLRTELSVK